MIAALLLIAVPLAFNAAFAGLAARFDYPDVLRRPTPEILERFAAGGTGLVMLWWSFAMTAAAMVPLVVLLAHELPGADPALLSLATTVGVLAAAVQLLGLIRWPFLVPHLARHADDPAAELVFQALHRYLGVAVGEHLGYLFTGGWTTLTGIALLQSTATPGWLGVLGLIVGPVLVLCSLEFLGPHERNGWKPAEKLTPAAYVAWSLWLIAIGVALLV